MRGLSCLLLCKCSFLAFGYRCVLLDYLNAAKKSAISSGYTDLHISSKSFIFLKLAFFPELLRLWPVCYCVEIRMLFLLLLDLCCNADCYWLNNPRRIWKHIRAGAIHRDFGSIHDPHWCWRILIYCWTAGLCGRIEGQQVGINCGRLWLNITHHTYSICVSTSIFFISIV